MARVVAPAARRNLPVLARATAGATGLGRPHEVLTQIAPKLPDTFFDHENFPPRSLGMAVGHGAATVATTMARGVAHSLPVVVPSAIGYFGFGMDLSEQFRYLLVSGLLALIPPGVGFIALIPVIVLGGIGYALRKKCLDALPDSTTYSESDAIRNLARQLRGLRKPWSNAQNSWARGEHEETAQHLLRGMRILLDKRQFALAEVWGDLAGVALLAGGFTVNAGQHFSGMAEAFDVAGAPKAAARSRLYAAYSTSRWDGVETDGLQRQRTIASGLEISDESLRAYWDAVLPVLGFPNLAQSPMRALIGNPPSVALQSGSLRFPE
ncbi:MAG: hypothetical protein HY696_11860 [Deltaproteobacteria bacterium]|nr:hypothetical protein [Deltaproteobacteria bacterium]